MPKLSIGHRLYISVTALFLIYAVCFMVFQQNREKQYKIDTLNLKLQTYNQRMHEALVLQDNKSEQTLNNFVKTHAEHNIRVTLIDRRGRVFYDNIFKDYARIGNHANRTEFIQAVKTGRGQTVDRNSSTLRHDYFYSATYFPKDGYIIRTALPYDNDLARSLQADQHYIWFSIVVILLLTLLLYRFISRLGRNITQLQTFAERADQNESLETEELIDFSDDELGEIAERIIKIYRRLQSTRQEQDILKRQLTQNIAHELKTPVAGIQGYLETILENPDMPDSTQHQFLTRCHAQSERLTSLLNDISILNRLDDGATAMQRESVEIHQLINQIEEETCLQLQAHGMTFSNQLPAGITISGNRSLLYSIFRNLTDNAIAYAGHGTTITLCAQSMADRWQFCFSDNGVGVANEHLRRIFERFYRIDKGRSRQNGGTGLGLSIVKNAVLFHGGSIQARNLPEGGLQFLFTLRREP